MMRGKRWAVGLEKALVWLANQPAAGWPVGWSDGWQNRVQSLGVLALQVRTVEVFLKRPVDRWRWWLACGLLLGSGSA